MIDLRAKPFFLNEEQLSWVESTLAQMTEDEKIGQLFINLTLNRKPDYQAELCSHYRIGGVRWQGGTPREVYDQNKFFQEHSKIPVLIAANCEAGGNGAVSQGTMVATGAACSASPTSQTVRDMARVGATEAKAIGCNWTFAPVCDVLSNWRNTIVNNRAFGSDPDQIIELSKAYMEEMHKQGIACAAKHFPGDGSEERDQHLLMGCNDLSCEEWDATYGKVYQSLIDAGLDSVMIGQICLPAYQKKLNSALTDRDIKPATLSPELLGGLLREKLGFNGLIVTDASHMAGLLNAAPRCEAVPGVVAAGCDMILFFNDPAEDIEYVRQALRDGRLTQARLDEAVLRILGMKAHLGLHHLTFPDPEGLKNIGCSEHHQLAARAADESITLVKDTQNLLPVDPSRKKRVMLYFIQSAPESLANGTDPAKQMLIEELEAAGFEVYAPKDYYELEMEGHSPANKGQMMRKFSREPFKKAYDLVIVAVNIKGYAQASNMRVTYSIGHSHEIPWTTCEVPTLAVSLNYTNHLYDLPMMKTFINAYAPTREYLHALVEKITGRSPFKGKANDLVWCGRWDTRL